MDWIREKLGGARSSGIRVSEKELDLEEEEIEEMVEEHLDRELKSDPDFDIPEPPGEPPEEFKPPVEI